MPPEATNEKDRRRGLGAHVRQYVPLAIVAIALLGFGMLADEVVEGDTLAFDRAVLLWFRVPGNIAVPIGPLWVQEAVRDVTSLLSASAAPQMQRVIACNSGASEVGS